MNAIDEYWFDVHGDNFPKDYTPSVVTMVWGGKGANATWFSARPEHVHGINWLPFQGGSLYLGRHPDYVEKNYAALVKENGGTDWAGWADLIRMYRALSDPADAMKQLRRRRTASPSRPATARPTCTTGSTRLNELGQVDADVTADYPLYAVFKKGKTRTYCVYNMDGRAADGGVLRRVPAEGGGQGVCHRDGEENEALPPSLTLVPKLLFGNVRTRNRSFAEYVPKRSLGTRSCVS